MDKLTLDLKIHFITYLCNDEIEGLMKFKKFKDIFKMTSPIWYIMNKRNKEEILLYKDALYYKKIREQELADCIENLSDVNNEMSDRISVLNYRTTRLYEENKELERELDAWEHLRY